MELGINYKRGQIFNADMGIGEGSEQSGYRPVVIIQNNIGNKYSSTVIVALITSKIKNNMPTHMRIGGEVGLNKDSVVMLEQLRTIDKSRLKRYIGMLNKEEMLKINQRLFVSLDLENLDLSDKKEKRKLNEIQTEQYEHIKSELNRIDNIICWWIGRGGDLSSISEDVREFNMRYNEFKHWNDKYNLNETYDIKYEKMLLCNEQVAV